MTKLADVLPDSDTLILALNAIANINHYSCGSLDININYASVPITIFRFHLTNQPKLNPNCHSTYPVMDFATVQTNYGSILSETEM